VKQHHSSATYGIATILTKRESEQRPHSELATSKRHESKFVEENSAVT
jgi:hypothetical protein